MDCTAPCVLQYSACVMVHLGARMGWAGRRTVCGGLGGPCKVNHCLRPHFDTSGSHVPCFTNLHCCTSHNTCLGEGLHVQVTVPLPSVRLHSEGLQLVTSEAQNGSITSIVYTFQDNVNGGKASVQSAKLWWLAWCLDYSSHVTHTLHPENMYTQDTCSTRLIEKSVLCDFRNKFTGWLFVCTCVYW